MSNPNPSAYTKYEQACARIRELQAEIKTLREALDAMEILPTGMSPAVCRAMARYWDGMADRVALAPKEPPP